MTLFDPPPPAKSIQSLESTDSLQTSKLRFDILEKEYEKLVTRIEGSVSRMVQLVIFLVGGLGAVIGFYLTGQFTDPNVLWLLSLTVVVLVGVVLNLFSDWSHLIFQTRVICKRLAEITKEDPSLFFFDRQSIPSTFNSLRRGNQNYRFMILTIFIIVVFSVILAIVYSFHEIYAANHLLGFLFAIIFSALSVVMLLSSYSIMVELPRLYDQRNIQSEQDDDVPAIGKKPGKTWDFIHILFPRPVDFITKTSLFVTGVGISLFINGPWFHPRIPDLFFSDFNSQNVSTQPYAFWMVIAFSALWFFVQEVLIQQAKYIWNDIRDKKLDKHVQGKQDRLATNLSQPIAVGLLIPRLIIGLVLGLYLDIRLFYILIVIILSQAIYELYVKPRGDKIPIVALLFVSTGTVIRVLGGILSVSNSINDIQIWLILGIAFFFGISSLAAFWKLETEHFMVVLPGKKLRLQGAYFLKHGSKIQDVGFTGAVISSLLAIVYALNSSTVDTFINQTRDQLLVVFHFLMNAYLLVIPVFIVVLIIALPLSKFFAKLILSGRKNTWGFIFPAAVISALYVLYQNAHPAKANLYWVAGALLIYNIFAFRMYKDITYDEYMLIHIKNNYRYILAYWYRYFFEAETGFHLGQMIYFTIRLMNAPIDQVIMEFQEAKQTQNSAAK